MKKPLSNYDYKSLGAVLCITRYHDGMGVQLAESVDIIEPDQQVVMIASVAESKGSFSPKKIILLATDGEQYWQAYVIGKNAYMFKDYQNILYRHNRSDATLTLKTSLFVIEWDKIVTNNLIIAFAKRAIKNSLRELSIK